VPQTSEFLHEDTRIKKQLEEVGEAIN